VAVASLDIAHSHAGGFEAGHHRPVPDDQRLVDAAAYESAVGDAPRRGPVPVHEAHHGLERRAAAVIVADVGKDERAGLQQQRSVVTRIPVGGRQGRDRAEARAHQTARRRGRGQRELFLKPRHQLGGQVTGVGRRVRVLGQPLAGIAERHDRLGDIEAVDEVIEHRVRRCVLQVIAAVVDDQQRVARRAPEPGRKIERHLGVAAQRSAWHRELDQRAMPGLRIRSRPVGHLVSVREANR
jgi:hypothetical protein